MSTIQLMEIPEMLSSRLALVPTVVILALAKYPIFPSHLKLQLLGRTRAVVFKPFFVFVC